MTNDKTLRHENSIRIVIIEDDETIREGFTYLLNNVENFQVTNSFASYEEAIGTIASESPDVILLDIQLPGISGVEAAGKLKQAVPQTMVIILTVHEDTDMIFEALSQGASGYLTKNTPPSRIIDAIKDAVTGGGPLSANVARIVIQSFQKNKNSPLTKREEEVIQLVSEGKSRSQIATMLFIDIETVKSHIKNIYFKLNVHTRADAIKAARDNKLIR